MSKAQGMTIQLDTIPAHTGQHNSLDQRKQLQTRLLQMLKSGTSQTMTRAPKSVTVKGDRPQTTCRPGRKYLQVGNQTPGHWVSHKDCSMPGSIATLAEAILQARASWGQSGTWSCNRAARGARTWQITRCHSAPRITAWTWDHLGVTAAGTFPVSSPWLRSRSWPCRMSLRTFPAVTLMAIPVSSRAIECHQPLHLSTKEKPEGNSTQQELYKGLSAVQALPCEASCSAWPLWITGFQLQTRLQLQGAAAASLDVPLQCSEC